LSRSGADELHLRDRVHHRGEAESRAPGLEQEVAAVGLATVFGLFEEDVHGEEAGLERLVERKRTNDEFRMPNE
jgi:hypothetical protein